jgi:hypothetical protein
MNLIENPYFNKAVQALAKEVESTRFSLVPYTSLVEQKNSPPDGLREAHQGEPEPLEIEAIVQIVAIAVAPALNLQVRRGQLPQLRRALQRHFEKRRGVSLSQSNHAKKLPSRAETVLQNAPKQS